MGLRPSLHIEHMQECCDHRLHGFALLVVEPGQHLEL